LPVLAGSIATQGKENSNIAQSFTSQENMEKDVSHETLHNKKLHKYKTMYHGIITIQTTPKKNISNFTTAPLGLLRLLWHK
jgi:hypothetical protein